MVYHASLETYILEQLIWHLGDLNLLKCLPEIAYNNPHKSDEPFSKLSCHPAKIHVHSLVVAIVLAQLRLEHTAVLIPICLLIQHCSPEWQKHIDVVESRHSPHIHLVSLAQKVAINPLATTPVLDCYFTLSLTQKAFGCFHKVPNTEFNFHEF